MLPVKRVVTFVSNYPSERETHGLVCPETRVHVLLMLGQRMWCRRPSLNSFDSLHNLTEDHALFQYFI